MIRVGLLGASRIAPRAVIEPAQSSRDVEVRVIAARDTRRAEAYAQCYGIPETEGSYGALLARPDIDLIYCPLPPVDHRDVCLEALAQGKALLIEKPFSFNAEHAGHISQAAAQRGRPALEAFHYRFHSLFRRALTLVQEGALGALREAKGVFDAQINTGPDELRWIASLGGGGAMDLGCYVVHALRTLTGEEPEVENVSAELKHGVDAQMRARLAFPGGMRAVVESSMLQPGKASLHLRGDRGEMHLQNFVSPQNGGRLVLRTGDQLLQVDAEGPSSYEAQLAHVVDVMKGSARALTGGEDAVANMRVLDQMRRMAGMSID